MNELYARIGALMDRQTRVLRVGWDLDGCVFWFHRAYIDGCKAIGALAADVDLAEPITWEFYEQVGHTLDQFLANCDTLADLGLLWSGPMIPGASTAWDAILTAGHEVHVVTDRSFGTHPVASQVGTRLFLAGHDRTYHSLTFTRRKTDVQTDVMIEDKVSNYDDLAATSCIPFLINRSWNDAPGDDRRRVDNHDEFLLEVLQMGAQVGPYAHHKLDRAEAAA